MNELITITIPIPRIAAPVQSQRVHPERRSRHRSPFHQSPSAASTKMAGRTASSPRTSGAATQASPAAKIQREERDASAFAIKKIESVAYG